MSRRTDILSELFSGLRIVHRATSPLDSVPSRAASTVAQKRRRQDPYVLAQARARKAANVSRQEVLRTERAKAAGDPVRGISTPFLTSFDDAKRLPDEKSATQRLNHFVTDQELQSSIQSSNLLSTPMTLQTDGATDPQQRERLSREHQEQHANAREALARITSLDTTSSKDRTHINIQRCIDTFGRHNTDLHLRPKPRSTAPRPEGYVYSEKTPRAGPDTGSSEVQISILTAKIRTLADFLETRGRKDKANKRNLRLLVHKRQKLLVYMRRKERGGERWQHLVNTLGLTEGTYTGEIVV